MGCYRDPRYDIRKLSNGSFPRTKKANTCLPIYKRDFDENGNIFLANYHTMEEATLVAQFYIDHGINAVIEHGAPWQEGAKLWHGVILHTVFLENFPDLAERIEAIPDEDYQNFIKQFNLVYGEKSREYELKHHSLRKPL